MSASVQTNLQSCQKAGSTKELPTNYLPETTAHERDIPGLCLSSLGFAYCFKTKSALLLFDTDKDFFFFFLFVFFKTKILKPCNKSHHFYLSGLCQLSAKPETIKCNIINYAMKISLIETCFY